MQPGGTGDCRRRMEMFFSGTWGNRPGELARFVALPVKRSGTNRPVWHDKGIVLLFSTGETGSHPAKTGHCGNRSRDFFPSGFSTCKTGNIRSPYGETFGSLARFRNTAGRNRHMVMNAIRALFPASDPAGRFLFILPFFLFVLFPVAELSCCLARRFVNVPAVS